MGNRPSPAISPVALDYVFGVLENKVEDTIAEFADGFALRLVEPAVLSFATLKRIVNPELSIRGVSLYASGGDVMVRAHVEGDSPDESLAILKTNAASRPKRRGKTSVWHLAEPSDHLKETLAGPVANVALAWLPINLKHAIGFVLGKTSFELKVLLAPGARLVVDDLLALDASARATNKGSVSISAENNTLVVTVTVPLPSSRKRHAEEGEGSKKDRRTA
jgi:hypothetical protein